MLKLLPKSEVDKRKAAERQMEVTEGKKLASKVDDLRQLAVQEESNLFKFRDETLKTITAQIKDSIARKEALDAEIKAKREELNTLSGPLDRAWLLYVNSEKKEIERLKKESEKNLTLAEQKLVDNDGFAKNWAFLREKELKTLEEKRLEWEAYSKTEREVIENFKADAQTNALETARKLAEVTKTVTKNEQEANRLKALRQDYEENLDRSKQLVESGKKIVLDAENKSRIILQEAKKLEKQTKDRATAVSIRESNISLKEANVAKREQEAEDRELKALAKELLYYSPVTKK